MPQIITKDDAQTKEDAAAERAATSAAFASVDEPVKVERPAAAQDDDRAGEEVADPKIAAEAAAKAAAEAEWEGVPVKVRQTLEAISGKVGTLDKIEHRLKGVEGRSGAALEGVHALKVALETAKTVAKDGGYAPTQAQIAAAATDDESWARLKEDFPDWAEGTDKRIDQRVEARLSKLVIPPAVDAAGLKAELAGTVKEIVAQATSEAKAEARELAKIDRKHENWATDIFQNGVDSKGGFTKEFTAWEAAQPPEIKALALSDKAGDAIKMLDGFYAHRNSVAVATEREAQNKRRLEGAIAPKGVGSSQAHRTLTFEEARSQGFASVDS